MKLLIKSVEPYLVNQLKQGRCTALLTKRLPKLKPPFEAYIYCSKKVNYGYLICGDISTTNSFVAQFGGKIVGKFICGAVQTYKSSWLNGKDYLFESTRLNDKEIIDFMDSYAERKFYVLHISDILFFDEPKELSEFSKFGCKILGGSCINSNCRYYISNGYYEPPQCAIDGCTINRPPHGWCYTEVSI